MPTDRPIVTLDVDGVLNAYDHGTEPSPWQPKVEDDPEPYPIHMDGTISLPGAPSDNGDSAKAREYRIQWSSELMDAIAQVADAGRITFVWLTSWDADAGILADRLLWPGRPSPVLGYIDSKSGQRRTTFASKRMAMARLCEAVAGSRPDATPPVISFDDDQPWNEMMWGRGPKLPGFFHGIGTDPRHGITRSQWEQAMLVAGDEADIAE